MPGWSDVAKWMALSRLDDGEGVERAFVLAYKITDDHAERWTERFNRIKNKDHAALAGAVAAFKARVPKLLRAIEIDPDDTVFLPAISSGETTASRNSFVTVLARESAAAAGSTFSSVALSKAAHSPIHGIFNAAKRTEALDGASHAAVRMTGTRNVVLVDDLITRGGTMSRYAKALRASNPKVTVYGIALGKTERRSFWGTLSNDHVHSRWDDLWTAGEARYRDWLAEDS